MARPKGPERVTVNVRIDKGLYDFLDDIHWDKRTRFPVMIENILSEWAVAQGWEPSEE